MKVNVCGLPHVIDFVDDNFFSDSANFGVVTYSKCRIRINKDMTDDMQRRTIIHEIVHGMLVHIGRDDLSNDETFVQTLALAIDDSFEIKYLKGDE